MSSLLSYLDSRHLQTFKFQLSANAASWAQHKGLYLITTPPHAGLMFRCSLAISLLKHSVHLFRCSVAATDGTRSLWRGHITSCKAPELSFEHVAFGVDSSIPRFWMSFIRSKLRAAQSSCSPTKIQLFLARSSSWAFTSNSRQREPAQSLFAQHSYFVPAPLWGKLIGPYSVLRTAAGAAWRSLASFISKSSSARRLRMASAPW